IEVTLVGRDEQVPLRAISRRMPHHVIERVEERNRVQGHLDAFRCRELGAHSAHALARGPLALMRFAFEDEDVGTAGFGQMIRDAGADNSTANDDDVGRLQETEPPKVRESAYTILLNSGTFLLASSSARQRADARNHSCPE